jgi:hypothetical protein
VRVVLVFAQEPSVQIVVEEHMPEESATLFRLQMSNRVIGENLTAAQAHLLVGEILGRLASVRRKAVSRGIAGEQPKETRVCSSAVNSQSRRLWRFLRSSTFKTVVSKFRMTT